MRRKLWAWLERRGHYDLNSLDDRLWDLLAASCKVLPHWWAQDAHSPSLDRCRADAPSYWSCLYCDAQRETYPHASHQSPCG